VGFRAKPPNSTTAELSDYVKSLTSQVNVFRRSLRAFESFRRSEGYPTGDVDRLSGELSETLERLTRVLPEIEEMNLFKRGG